MLVWAIASGDACKPAKAERKAAKNQVLFEVITQDEVATVEKALHPEPEQQASAVPSGQGLAHEHTIKIYKNRNPRLQVRVCFARVAVDLADDSLADVGTERYRWTTLSVFDHAFPTLVQTDEFSSAWSQRLREGKAGGRQEEEQEGEGGEGMAR